MTKILRFAGRRTRATHRVLRTYRRVADKKHECNLCSFPIRSGDEYEADVRIWRGRFQVLKMHYPDCPEDPLEEDIRRKIEEERLREARKKKVA